MKQFKKSLSLFLYFITLFFLISCGFPVDGFREAFELPDGLYGGDIYSAYAWYWYSEGAPFPPQYNSLRLGYTYDSEIMDIDNVNILVHFGILEERISQDLLKGFESRFFDENIKEFILKIYFQTFSDLTPNVGNDITIIKEYKINISDEQWWNEFKATNIIIEDRGNAKMCKTEYSESCIFNFNITDALFKYYLDNNIGYSLINGICITLELTQEGKTNILTNFAYIRFNYDVDKVEIVPFKIDFVEI